MFLWKMSGLLRVSPATKNEKGSAPASKENGRTINITTNQIPAARIAVLSLVFVVRNFRARAPAQTQAPGMSGKEFILDYPA
jgi:hypothetical protein